MNGIIITGSHKPLDIENKLDLIQLARERNIPFLGICLGLQLMAIEFSRNVLGVSDATSEEFGMGTHVVVKMPQMRVGISPVVWYNGVTSFESHWHHYKIAENIIPRLRETFWISESGGIVEIMHLPTTKHRHFVGLQFHPEYQSSKERPHPALIKFINECKKVTQ